MQIRVAGEDDWALVRALRLRALVESAETFGSSAPRERRFVERHWRMRLRTSPTWLALDEGGVAHGMVSLIQEPGSPVDDRHVVGLWVAPESRRAGVGWALLDTVSAAARAQHAQTVSLWVVDSNLPAVDLYVRFGFARTGERQPLPREPERTEERYVLALNRAGAGGTA